MLQNGDEAYMSEHYESNLVSVYYMGICKLVIWGCDFLSLLGVPVSEWQVWVRLPGQEEPKTDQLDCAVQTQAQEGPVCK